MINNNMPSWINRGYLVSFVSSLGEQLVVLGTANNLSLGVVFFLLIRIKTLFSKDMFLKKELL